VAARAALRLSEGSDDVVQAMLRSGVEGLVDAALDAMEEWGSELLQGRVVASK
jgi:hypothetical protein